VISASTKATLLNNIVWVLLAITILIIGIIEPRFFSPMILGNVVTQATVLGILSFAQAFAILLGFIDLSLLGVMSFSATSGLILIRMGCPVALAIPVILLVGFLIGMLNGVLIAKLKAVPLVETLAVKLTLLGAFLVITSGRAITNLPARYKWFGQGRISGVPVLPIILVITFIVIYIVWNWTPFGRCLFAVGGNPEASRISGIKEAGVLADFFHMSIEEDNIADSIRQMGGSIRHVHLGDSNRKMPGLGSIDWVAGFTALKDQGYDGFINLECSTMGIPETAIPAAAQFLNGILARI